MCRALFSFVMLMVSLPLAVAATLPAVDSTAANGSAVSRTWAVVTHPTLLVNGSPILFRITPPMPVHSLSGMWLGHGIAFSFDASTKSWFPPGGNRQETQPRYLSPATSRRNLLRSIGRKNYLFRKKDHAHAPALSARVAQSARSLHCPQSRRPARNPAG